MEIVQNSIKETWLSALYEVYTKGQTLIDERNSKTKELINLSMTTIYPFGFNDFLGKDLRSVEIPNGFPFKIEAQHKYAEQLLNPDLQGFVYTYGNRLREYFKTDQIENIINRINNDNSTRRAIAITIDPIRDYQEEEIPCLQQISFLVRNGRLHLTAMFRSNDIYGANFMNQLGLLNIFKYVSDETNIDVGSLTLFDVSAHIYEINFKDTEKILKLNNYKI